MGGGDEGGVNAKKNKLDVRWTFSEFFADVASLGWLASSHLQLLHISTHYGESSHERKNADTRSEAQQVHSVYSQYFWGGYG